VLWNGALRAFAILRGNARRRFTERRGFFGLPASVACPSDAGAFRAGSTSQALAHRPVRLRASNLLRQLSRRSRPILNKSSNRPGIPSSYPLPLSLPSITITKPVGGHHDAQLSGTVRGDRGCVCDHPSQRGGPGWPVGGAEQLRGLRVAVCADRATGRSRRCFPAPDRRATGVGGGIVKAGGIQRRAHAAVQHLDARPANRCGVTSSKRGQPFVPVHRDFAANVLRGGLFEAFA